MESFLKIQLLDPGFATPVCMVCEPQAAISLILLKSRQIHIFIWNLYSFYFVCSTSKSCLPLLDSMNCSTPGFPAFHYPLEFGQTHVPWVGDTIQPSQSLIKLFFLLNFLKHTLWHSLVVQWLRFCLPNAGGPGSILNQGARSHVPQLRLGPAK